MLYLGPNDYYPRVIVHETGHAYDKFLGDVLTDWDANWYSLDVLDMNSIVLKEVQNFDETHSSVIYGFKTKGKADYYLKTYCLNASDSSIVEDENGLWNIIVSYNNPINPMGATYGGHMPGYITHDYAHDSREYFADAFQLYWLGDYDSTEEGGISRLEFLCPETYKELYKIISADINGELDKYSLVERY